MNQVTQWMQTVIFTIFGICVLTACTKDGDVIYVTDPADQVSSAPLVIVVYSANALGDGNYMTVSESEAESKELTIKYLSDDVYGGFTVSDDVVVDIMKAPIKQSFYNLVVPICGGAATTFQRMCEVDWLYQYMGIDAVSSSFHCPFSAVKQIDNAVVRCIGQWLSTEGMPKHQTLGLAEGYTEVVIHPYAPEQQENFIEKLTDGLRATIHNEAIRREELKMKNEE